VIELKDGKITEIVERMLVNFKDLKAFSLS